MKKIKLGLFPKVLIAIVLGSLLGYFLLNPLFTLILGGYGVKNADLLLRPMMIVVSAAAVTAMVFVFSFLMSGRMKKLSAYKLIQE